MRTRLAGAAVVTCVAIAAVAWWRLHSEAATGASSADPAPIAQVQARRPERRTMVETLSAIGDVTPGQLIGVSFPRAGQITRLAVLAGDRVTRGAVLAALSPDPATLLAYTQAVTAMNSARRELERQRELLDLRLATQSQVDSAQKASADATSAVESLRQTGGGSGKSTITAPFDGVVMALSSAQGDRVAAGAAILQLGQVGALRVQLGIEPSESRRVKPGMPVRLVPVAPAAATAARPTAAIEATVGEVQDIVDPRTQLVTVLVRLRPGPSVALVPGTKMRATIEVGRVDATAVPRDAVLTDERGAYVFQVVDGKAERVAVTVRIESGGWTAVDGLADANAPVVVLGNYELTDGMAVATAAVASGAASAASARP